MSAAKLEHVASLVRDIEDFPKPGILFRDLTPVLADAKAFAHVLELWTAAFADKVVDAVVGIEARGFIFGAALAAHLRRPFVPIRKPGKLPARAHRIDYDLEYGQDALEIHVDALPAQSRALLVDDVLATGGTAAAAIQLLGRQQVHLVGVAFVLELIELGGHARLGNIEHVSLLRR
ncbi:MAG: adenine phosphoribosyltransferase [Polyangiales bacterium]